MIIEILTIGREILDGRVTDTNSVALALAIGKQGWVPRFGQRVDDQIDRMINAFTVAQSRSQIILVTGGLGPTSDDLTAEAFARFKNLSLDFNPEAHAQIEEFLKKSGRPKMIEAQRKQAFIPKGCTILPNPEGTAPGFAWLGESHQWFFMPGVPLEMSRMLDEQVIPKLPKKPDYETITWITQFTAESELQRRLSPVEAKLPKGFEITYRTKFPENHIGLHAEYCNSRSKEAFETLSNEIQSLLGESVLTSARGNEPLLSLETLIQQELNKKSLRLKVLETSTSGFLTHQLTMSNLPKPIVSEARISPLLNGFLTQEQALAMVVDFASSSSSHLDAEQIVLGLISADFHVYQNSPLGIIGFCVILDPKNLDADKRRTIEPIHSVRKGLDPMRFRSFLTHKSLNSLLSHVRIRS